jgi:hypothetical protein
MSSKLNKKYVSLCFLAKPMEPIFIFDKTNATNFNHFKREKTSFFVAPQLDKL